MSPHSPLRKRRNQCLHIRYPEAAHQVVPGHRVIRAVTPGLDISEARAAQRIDQRVQERQRCLTGLHTCLVNERAESGPHRRAPTGTTILLDLTVQQHEATLVRIGRDAHVREESATAAYARPCLPGRAREVHALATAPAGP